MSEINRVVAFGKLNALAYKAIEGATVFCKLRGNPYVEIEHWLQQILQTPDSDLHHIVRHFDVDPSRLSADLTAAWAHRNAWDGVAGWGSARRMRTPATLRWMLRPC